MPLSENVNKGNGKEESRPIKIVRILARMNIGGPSIHAVFLTEGLNSAKFRSVLVTGVIGRAEGDMAYFAKQRGVTPLIVPELGREISWWIDLVCVWKLYRLLVRERPDIVHTHTSKAGAVGRVAAMLARVPIRIHTFHGHVFHDYFGPLKTRLFILIERWLAFATTRIVAISQEQLADLFGRYRIAPREKFALIPLGLELAPFLRGQESRHNPGGNGREVVIGFIGRLVPIKNPQMAIQAFKRLVDLGTGERPVRLVIVGDGELKTDLEKQVQQAGLQHLVEFTGWRQDLADLYASLDLVILTSLNEGTPVTLLEAIAGGLPFVATRVGGVLDLMCGTEQAMSGTSGRGQFSLFLNGAVVEPNDVEGFAAAVKYLLSDPPMMQRMGVEGRRLARAQYSRERLLRDMETLYLKCLESDSHPTRGLACTI